MRSSLSALVASGLLLVAPGFADAQRLPPLPPPPVSLAVPHPIPPISISPAPPSDLFQQLTGTEGRMGGRTEGRRRRLMYSPGVFFGPSAYMPGYGYPTSYGYPTGYGAPAETVPAAQAIPRGGLRFDTSPGSAQVYVDGFYAGLVIDFGISGRALDLEAGQHRIELRAAGYATLAFDISIPAYQTVRYRGDLERLSPAAPPTADIVPAPKAKTMYVIPNCYAGDRPPVRALPRGCDIKQLQTRN